MNLLNYFRSPEQIARKFTEQPKDYKFPTEDCGEYFYEMKCVHCGLIKKTSLGVIEPNSEFKRFEFIYSLTPKADNKQLLVCKCTPRGTTVHIMIRKYIE